MSHGRVRFPMWVLAGLIVLSACGSEEAVGPTAAETKGRVFGPAHAARVQDMLAPIRFEEPFDEGCRLDSLAVERDAMRFAVEGPEGASVLVVAPLADDRPAQESGHSLSFSARLEGHAGPPASWPTCAAAVWTRLRQADDGTFWPPAPAEPPAGAPAGPGQGAGPGDPGGDQPSGPTGAAEGAPSRPLLWSATFFLGHLELVLLLGVAGLVLWNRETRPRPSPRTWVPLAIATLLGAAARVGLAPHGFFHDNWRGYRHFGRLIGGNPDLTVGPGHIVLFGPLYKVLPPHPDVLIFANLTLSVLSIPLAGLVAWLLTNRRSAAVLASLFFALHPLFVKTAPTELLHVSCLFFFLLSLAGILLALRTGHALWYLLGVSALLLCVQIRPESIFLSIAPLIVLALRLHSAADEKQRRWALLSVGAFGLLLVPHILTTLPTLATRPAAVDAILGSQGSSLFQGDRDTWFSPRFNLPTTVLAAAAGLAWLLARRRGWGAALLLGCAVAAFLGYTIPGHNIDTFRFQLPFHVFGCLFAGCAVAWFAPGGPDRDEAPPRTRRLRQAATVLVGVAAVAPIVALQPFISRPLGLQQEYRFLMDAASSLPRGSTVLLLPDPVVGQISSLFPSAYFAHVDPEFRTAWWTPADVPLYRNTANLYFYVGLSSYSFIDEAERDRALREGDLLRPESTGILETLGLRPTVWTRRLSVEDQERFFHSTTTPTIGFWGRPPPAAGGDPAG